MPDIDISKDLKRLLYESYYEIESFSVADILAKNTIDGYINSGDFFCISTSNYENVKFSLSQKKLSIEIQKDLLYSLGAVHLSKFQKEVVNETHKFEIDLSYNHLDKLRSELSNELIDKVRILFKWHPTALHICSSSIAKYFEDMGYNVKGLENQTKIEPQYGLKMPQLPSEIEPNDDEELTAMSEYLGMIFLGCDMTTIEKESTVNALDVGRGKLIYWKGLTTNNQLKGVVKELQEAIIKNSSFPYIALSIIPFSSTVNCSPRTILISSNEFLIFQ